MKLRTVLIFLAATLFAGAANAHEPHICSGDVPAHEKNYPCKLVEKAMGKQRWSMATVDKDIFWHIDSANCLARVSVKKKVQPPSKLWYEKCNEAYKNLSKLESEGVYVKSIILQVSEKEDDIVALEMHYVLSQELIDLLSVKGKK